METWTDLNDPSGFKKKNLQMRNVLMSFKKNNRGDFKVIRKAGKKIGDTFYMHRSVNNEKYSELINKAIELLDKNFDYEVLKINEKKKEISFIQSLDWNTAHEPIVGDSYKININTHKITFCKGRKNNPQIYHHKWMFVEDDYKGFDVEESKQRSKTWENSGIEFDRKKIGNSNYWTDVVLNKMN
jgi:hypothetical protein